MKKRMNPKRRIQIVIREDHIGYREAIALTTLFTSSKIFLSFPEKMVKEGSSAGWQIPLLAGIFTAILVFVIYKCMADRNGQSMIELGFQEIGNVFGVLSGLCYTVFFFVLGALVLREFTETVVATVLPYTPVSAIAIPFMLTNLYIAYQGPEGLSRVALLVGPISLIGVGIFMALDISLCDIHYVFPLGGNGFKKTIGTSFLKISSYSELFLLAILFPFLRSKKQFRSVCIWSVAASIGILTVVVFFYIMLFPEQTGSRLTYPFYQISQLVNQGRFLQRIEAIFIFLWVSCAVIKVGLSLWASSICFAESIRIPMYKPLMVPLATLMYTASFIPQSFMDTVTIEEAMLRNWSQVIMFGFPLIVFAVLSFRKRKQSV